MLEPRPRPMASRLGKLRLSQSCEDALLGGRRGMKPNPELSAQPMLGLGSHMTQNFLRMDTSTAAAAVNAGGMPYHALLDVAAASNRNDMKPFAPMAPMAPMAPLGAVPMGARLDDSVERPYPCHFCDARFKKKQHLQNHERIHTGEKYVCTLCGQAFSRMHILKHHLERKHADPPKAIYALDQSSVAVGVAGDVWATADWPAAGVAPSRAGDDKLIHAHGRTNCTCYCDALRRSFKHWKSVLFDSLTNLHSSLGFGSLPAPSTASVGDPFRPYACHICGKRFKLNHHLKQHSRIHTGERPFACNLCGKTFTQQSSYHYHMKKKLCVPHPSTPEAPRAASTVGCGVPCKATHQHGLEGGVGGLGGALLPDMTQQGMSGAASSMSCVGIPSDVMNAYVSLTNSTEAGLGVGGDLSTHPSGWEVNERPAEGVLAAWLMAPIPLRGRAGGDPSAQKLHCCPYCTKQFRRKDHLTQHVRIHTGEKPYRCERCGRGFNQKSPLMYHQSICR
ncbi:Zinc finger protein 569 [Chionoecetes opilio]|uniref:Zinc finger protein 569 n=1 Tax=Chionoecetes opilio TaxID=41210 RepID=A0A8J4XYG5_CHIOP|nr:Zinc finger protein 569 [Chionoecetes opilio]